MYEISVIVSTWRRVEILKKVVSALLAQSMSAERFEILVIDSRSGDGTDEAVQDIAARSGRPVRLVNCEINSISAKRNLGIQLANGCYLIFLDDDCIPDPDHLERFLASAADTRGQRVAWCGGVRFDKGLISASNYYRYRDECHFSKLRPRAEKLEFREIVTMNMMIEKAVLLESGVTFDERFLGYGYEDVEFGWQLTKRGFSIRPSPAEILHEELNGSLVKFKNKIYHSSRDGFPVFRKVAPDAISVLGRTTDLERGREKLSAKSLRRAVLYWLLDSKLPSLVEWFLTRTDRIGFLYVRHAFRFVLASAYRKGSFDRIDSSQVSVSDANKRGWYS
ncbi:glycosyltransferase family 2 protein [Cupriavidus sp. WS]|uniref:glycosyltransferase family 2 protein n=1 Tax=Cupriavidus sp. WS TaxID=1312922 RepID=UPI0018C9CA88|nr:glycosyltransferase family 2 protein [Cupriavidus sp. WS]